MPRGLGPLVRGPVGVELAEELGAAFLLVGLADGGRRVAQAFEGAEEAAVALVGPAHVPRSPPSRGAQRIEAAVVADAEAGVGLDVVAPQLAQLGPGVDEARERGGYACHCVAAALGRFRASGGQSVGGLGRGRGQHRLRQTAGEVHGGVRHATDRRLGTITCLFCAIRDGDVPAHLVLDEAEVFAFLDIRPLFPGHALVVPRAHVEVVTDVPDALVAPLFHAVQRVSAAVQEAMGAQGIFNAVNNVVSQSVPHLHVHVVPRTKGDGLRGFFWPRQTYASDDEAAAVAERIRAALDG